MKKTEQIQKEIIKEIPENFREKLISAIDYAQEFHKDQKRYDGKPLIQHLLNIACSTTKLELDTNSTIASILHEISLNQEENKYIIQNFGKEVLDILKKINDIKRSTQSNETPGGIIIKYILNSSKDLRPVIIKILDTLEDIKTIKDVPEQERKDSLLKALNIYSILAEYLNLNTIKKEIEEHAFKQYLPVEYNSISKIMDNSNINEKQLKKYESVIWEEIKNLPFKKEIKGRIKCKYSIYNKLKKYEKEWINPNINRIDDLIAFRITTQKEEDCFFILEKLMDKGEMNYDRFDDYISNPKPNGYKAIQFPIKFSEISDLEIELQIVTEDMYYYNKYGPASHVAYKASKSRYAKPSNQYDWIEEIQKQIVKCKKERLKKTDVPILCNIFEDEVFVFTPKGKIIDMNKGDTVLDYAFKVHTEIANRAISANINGKISKLSTVLKTGDVVEVITDRNKKCQKIESLKYTNSMSTKFKIRNQLSKLKRKY